MERCLKFIRSHVAAEGVLQVRTKRAALIAPERMSRAIRATCRISRVNRWASRRQSHRLRRPTIVLQRSQHGVGVVQISGVGKRAGAIAA